MLYETNSRSSDFRERHKAWGFHLWFTIELDDAVSIADAVEAYQALSFVEIAEPFYKTELHGTGNKARWSSNDPRLTDQWHYKNTGQAGGTPGCDISLFDAWEIEKGNSNVIVSVVDCGINVNHPDLQANMWSQIGYNFWQNTPNITPGDHGCHTGGTVAAVTNNGVGVAGVAGGTGTGDGVRLMTCQVFNSAGNNGGGFANAYIYAADNGACISQNSWGYTAPNYYDQAVLNAIDYFIANGGGDVMQDGIVIFAAGNNSSNNQYYPGCYAPVLAVSGTNNKDQKAGYSNYGTWVNISAPGGVTNYNPNNPAGVLSCTVNSYAYFEGTSMACPHVSGVAALLVSYAARYGYILSRQEVWNLLVNNVDDHYPVNPTFINQLGSGRLNAYKALLALTEMVVVIQEPENVSATPISYAEIELNWKKNENNDEIIVFSNMANEFGNPDNEIEYHVGDLLSEGGEVIYRGDAETFLHSELSSGTTYYYKLFSYTENYEYSKGVACEATTLCRIMELFFEGFEDGYNICLEQEYVTGDSPWLIGTGNGGSFPDHAYQGDYNIFLSMDYGILGNETRLILPVMDMTEFNNVQLSFALHNQTRYGQTDELSIYYRISKSKTWNIWKIYNSSQNVWLLDTIILPENVNTEELQICFEGKIRGGYGICLDNISVEGFISNIGIADNGFDNKVSVHPNPTTGILQVTSEKLQVTKIEVFDIYGRIQKVESGIQKGKKDFLMDISDLTSGIYFLKIQTETGVVTRKVVKK